MATDPLRMNNGIMVFIPPNGDNVIPAGQGIPATVISAPGTVQYPQFANQPLRSNQLQQNRPLGTLEKFLKVEAKTLAAIQIVIGFIHIGFGAVSSIVAYPYTNISTFGGYPFWGGLFFIASGAISVYTEKKFNKTLVKCNMGMNLTSAIMASIGMVLFIVQLTVNSNDYYGQDRLHAVGTGLCVMLFLFTLLEFCIAASEAHLRCEETYHNCDMTMAFMPYSIIENVTPTPPAYDQVVRPPNGEIPNGEAS
uniref:Membrane spanning 4-domains A8 n=1 Tax=Anolis carolinensis TaxID=28377 RepID=H9GVK7_ANOCA|nr:PREDICTED: membrane-spanning 4-domains subfamily A member 15 [Anolis carolinensis]|eukprot:XP_008114039.1 PREDICTED: membrane-spanning 4-domains subfamily A member 15 [Anolis carolinensis]